MTLSLYANEKYSTWNNSAKTLYKITGNWDAKTVNYNNQPKYSTSGGVKNSNTSIGVWEDYDVTTFIKNIIENNEQNYGFILDLSSSWFGGGVKMCSSEFSTAANRPKLTITYEGGSSDQQAPQVLIEAPSSGQVLFHNANATILWDANDNVGIVACAIYFTNGNGRWELIDSLNSNPGRLVWRVPSNVTSERCKVKVNAYDEAENMGFAESGVFTIEPATSIKPNLFNIPLAEKYTVQITNIQGREVASFVTKDLNRINKMMTSLSSGVHILRITTPDKIYNKQIRVVR